MVRPKPWCSKAAWTTATPQNCVGPLPAVRPEQRPVRRRDAADATPRVLLADERHRFRCWSASQRRSRWTPLPRPLPPYQGSSEGEGVARAVVTPRRICLGTEKKELPSFIVFERRAHLYSEISLECPDKKEHRWNNEGSRVPSAVLMVPSALDGASRGVRGRNAWPPNSAATRRNCWPWSSSSATRANDENSFTSTSACRRAIRRVVYDDPNLAARTRS